MNATLATPTQSLPANKSASFEMDCFSPFMIVTNGVWLGDNPLNYALPLFLVQTVMITLTSRALHLVLRPLCQPMILAEILGGLALGPTLAGRFFGNFQALFFPPRSISLLSSAGNLGILYFLFMVGVEMDVGAIKNVKKKVAAIGVASTVFPFAITFPAAYLFRHHFHEQEHDGAFFIYLAAALSTTSFHLLNRILTELKLVTAEIGRITLVVALLNLLLSWVLVEAVVVVSGIKGKQHSAMPSLYIVLSSIGFVLVCILLVQPALKWFVKKTPEGEPMSDADLGIVIMGAMMAGYVTDFIGVGSYFGAFVYGLAFPHGPHGTALVGRLEYFITGLFLPIYFGTSGLRIDLFQIQHASLVAIIVFLFAFSSISKVLASSIVSLSLGVPLAEGIALGVLLASQTHTEFILLRLTRDKDMVKQETYAILVMMSPIMTALVKPLVKQAYKRTRTQAKYKRRTIMGAKPNSELRVLACIHSNSNVPSVINLLDMSNPTKRSPIFVSALHLVELTGWSSAMHVVHESGSKSSSSNQVQSKHIVVAFENYEQHAGGVSIQALTAVSPYPNMHDDICTLAADNHAAIIILPFDKLQTITGNMESANPDVRNVNQNVLDNAPCSVAILVDRGLNKGKANFYTPRHVILLFFGGPDDREALSYVQRMADHPSIILTVWRFVPGEEIAATPSPLPLSSSENNALIPHSSIINVENSEADPDQTLDNECISEFRLKNLGNKSMKYVEKVVNSSEETVATIRSVDRAHDLYVVGRSHGTSPLTKGLTDWTEHPELGSIGDLLASDFEETLSVLVVQQYTGAGIIGRDVDRGDGTTAPGKIDNIKRRHKETTPTNVEYVHTKCGENSQKQKDSGHCKPSNEMPEKRTQNEP